MSLIVTRNKLLPIEYWATSTGNQLISYNLLGNSFPVVTCSSNSSSNM